VPEPTVPGQCAQDIHIYQNRTWTEPFSSFQVDRTNLDDITTFTDGWNTTMNNENLYLIQGHLYYTDWREDDLRMFWSMTMNDDIAEGINEGAKLMGKNRTAVVKMKPREW
jgi:hypothetical protein